MKKQLLMTLFFLGSGFLLKAQSANSVLELFEAMDAFTDTLHLSDYEVARIEIGTLGKNKGTYIVERTLYAGTTYLIIAIADSRITNMSLEVGWFDKNGKYEYLIRKDNRKGGGKDKLDIESIEFKPEKDTTYYIVVREKTMAEGSMSGRIAITAGFK